MPSDAKHVYNTKLYYLSTPPSTYTQIARIRNVRSSGITVSSSEDKNLNSANAVVGKVPGFVNYGQVSFTFVYNKTTYALWRTFLRSTKGFKIEQPDAATGSTDVFEAFVVSITLPQAEDDGVIAYEVTLDIDGADVFTEGS